MTSRKTYTFRPSPDVRELIEQAIAVGVKQVDLIEGALRESGWQVLKDLTAGRWEALKALEAKAGKLGKETLNERP